MNGYFDNAATSFPKPDAVAEAMQHYLRRVGGPYGRSSHGRAFEVSRTVERARDAVARCLGTTRTDQIAFLPNATTALNLALRGLLSHDATVYVSPLEHNAVMRPLHMLAEDYHVAWKLLPALQDGMIDVEQLDRVAAAQPDAVVINHQSNMNGVVQPLAQIRRHLPDVPIIVDASQSLGNQPMEVDAWRLDAVAWTGHKGLLGPPGIGGVFLRDPASVRPLIFGGTGSRSADYAMPEAMPDRLEAGTPHIVGIYGLLAALEQPPEPAHTPADWLDFISRLKQIPGLSVWAAENAAAQGRVVSVTHARISVSELGDRLWKEHEIAVRVGLHCAPLAHRCLGTFPEGTVRLAASVYHAADDLDRAISAIREVCQT